MDCVLSTKYISLISTQLYPQVCQTLMQAWVRTIRWVDNMHVGKKLVLLTLGQLSNILTKCVRVLEVDNLNTGPGLEE